MSCHPSRVDIYVRAQPVVFGDSTHRLIASTPPGWGDQQEQDQNYFGSGGFTSMISPNLLV